MIVTIGNNESAIIRTGKLTKLANNYGKIWAHPQLKVQIKPLWFWNFQIWKSSNKPASYPRKYRYRERTESTKVLGGRMEKMWNVRFSKNKKLCGPCGNIQNDRKFPKKWENIFVFRSDFCGRCPAWLAKIKKIENTLAAWYLSRKLRKSRIFRYSSDRCALHFDEWT